MRFIDLSQVAPTDDWLQKAQALSQELDEAESEAARREIIEDNADLWKELLPFLRAVTKGKCWFSESRGACQYWEVEHFRPKGAARNLDGSLRADGYWWLAFDWKNFRLSGGVTNRKKGHFFPLRQGSHVANANDRNIDDEDCYLLDPTKSEDPPLLTFNSNGEVVPTPGTSAWHMERAAESIKRFKLQEHEAFVEARKAVWAKCQLEINKCQNLLQEEVDHPSATKREKIREQVKKLRAMGDFYEEFSAAANDCLRSSPEPFFRKLAAPN